MSNTTRNLIRQMASSYSGQFLATAKFEKDIDIWNIENNTFIRRLRTILDFGGKRLAISYDGNKCIVGSYSKGGVVCYDMYSGHKIWQQKEICKSQSIRFSFKDENIFVCTDVGSHTLRSADGVIVDFKNDINKIIASQWGPMVFLSGKEMGLRNDSEPMWSIPRITFAELDVAFSPRYLCISESGGPIRCWDIDSRAELWRHYEKGWHATKLCYNHAEDCFFAVDFAYQQEGIYRLLRFDVLNGKISIIVELKDVWESAFCLEGSYLITAGGSVIETVTGATKGHLPIL